MDQDRNFKIAQQVLARLQELPEHLQLLAMELYHTQNVAVNFLERERLAVIPDCRWEGTRWTVRDQTGRTLVADQASWLEAVKAAMTRLEEQRAPLCGATGQVRSPANGEAADGVAG